MYVTTSQNSLMHQEYSSVNVAHYCGKIICTPHCSQVAVDRKEEELEEKDKLWKMTWYALLWFDVEK